MEIKRRLFTIFVIILMGFSPLLVSLSSNSGASTIYSDLAYSADLPIRDLKKGDLVFCDVKPIISQIANNNGNDRIQSAKGYSDDHVLMYIGNNKFIESCPYFYNPLKSEWIGVVTTPLIALKVWATNFTYGRVDTTQGIKSDAIRWAKTQRGMPYGTNGYYCGELISNAYKEAGINLTVTTWSADNYMAWGVNGLKNADLVEMLSPNIPPIAKIYLEDSIDLYVYLHGYHSEDIDGGIKNYLWDMGDGTNFSEPYASHKYQKPGEYKITLTVTDYPGDTDTAETTVLIEGQDPDDDNNSDEEDQSEDDEIDSEDTITNDADKIKENGNSFLGIIVISVIIGIFALLIIALFWVLRK